MASDAASPALAGRRAVFRSAALWLLFLAPFFYLTYGTANWLASIRPDVPDLAFSWERHVPFLAWTIVPYWSINLFYAVSLFVNDTPEDVGRLARHYLTAQCVAVACFLAFPLQATFVRPPTEGLPGFMFDVLGGFDKPFNQAPSLHIALLVIIWDHLRHRFNGAVRAAWHVWCLLIGASVLTTWQHHAIDIPAGALLGLFALWLFPRNGPSPAAGFRLTRDRNALRLAACYIAGALGFLLAAIVLVSASGAALFLLWPALALAIVAFGYAGAGPAVFQKDGEGRVSLAGRWLLMPYRLGARLNMLAWTARLPAAVAVTESVHLGRFPRRHELKRYAAVIDMTGEFPALSAPGLMWRAYPSLDLLPAPAERLNEAAAALDDLQKQGPVLVCCALGFQRSAAVVACWLIRKRLADDDRQAADRIAALGRRVHFRPETLAEISGATR